MRERRARNLRNARRAGLVLTVVVAVAVLAPGLGGGPAHAQVDGEPTPTLPEPTADPDAVRAEAERILSGDEFGGEEGRDGQGEPSGGSGADGGPGGERPPPRAELPEPPVFSGMGPIAQAIMWVLLVALAALAVWIVVRAVRVRRARASSEATDDDPWVDLEAEDATARPAGDWLELAEGAEARGAWREGLLYRYRSLVASLADRGIVAPVPGRTVGEHRAEVAAAAPGASAAFASAGWLFERAWYGNRPTGPDERDAFRREVDRVEAATATVPDHRDATPDDDLVGAAPAGGTGSEGTGP